MKTKPTVAPLRKALSDLAECAYGDDSRAVWSSCLVSEERQRPRHEVDHHARLGRKGAKVDPYESDGRDVERLPDRLSAPPSELSAAANNYREWWDEWSRLTNRGDLSASLAKAYVNLCEVRLLKAARGEPIAPLPRKPSDPR